MPNYYLAWRLTQNSTESRIEQGNTSQSCPTHYPINSSFSHFSSCNIRVYMNFEFVIYVTHAVSLLCLCVSCCWLLYLAALATNSINTHFTSVLTAIIPGKPRLSGSPADFHSPKLHSQFKIWLCIYTFAWTSGQVFSVSFPDTAESENLLSSTP